MIALACDLGGTRIKFGLVSGGRLLASAEMPAESDRGLKRRLPVLARALRALAKRQGTGLKECAGVAMAFASLVDPASGRVLAEYGKYRDAPELDLPAWAEKELGLPLAIENDSRMALIGEWRQGAGRGCGNIVMLTLGTGLGTAALIEGRLLRGCHGQAGCLGGHLTVRYGGRLCHCGNVGCAEAEASTAFLPELARSQADFPSSALRKERRLDYAAVFRQAAGGDRCARRIRDHSMDVWSAAVVNLIHAYDPELVIVGGGIMGSSATIMPRIRRQVRLHAHTPWGKVRVRPAQLGDAAGLLAAEWLLQGRGDGR